MPSFLWRHLFLVNPFPFQRINGSGQPLIPLGLVALKRGGHISWRKDERLVFFGIKYKTENFNSVVIF
jgi:hypothetical protein